MALTASLAELARYRTKRRHRTSPRRVKRARHNSYQVKRPGDVIMCHTGPPTIVINAVA